MQKFLYLCGLNIQLWTEHKIMVAYTNSFIEILLIMLRRWLCGVTELCEHSDGMTIGQIPAEEQNIIKVPKS